MAAHTGRCFRATRRTKLRKARQGKSWLYPIRHKAPAALRAFLGTADRSQRMAAPSIIQAAMGCYTAFVAAVKKTRAAKRGG